MNWLKRTHDVGPYTNGGNFAHGLAYFMAGGVNATHGLGWGLLTIVCGVIVANVIDSLLGRAA